MAAQNVDFTIPKTYKAMIYDKPGTISTKLVELETPEPGHGEVLVRLTHSGVCHSDLGIMENSWAGIPPIQAGLIGGHEGVGIVQKLGPGNENSPVKLGDRVGIKWVVSICMSCGTPHCPVPSLLPQRQLIHLLDACLDGQDARCTSKTNSGFSRPGTFQQYVTSPANYVTPIPPGLDSALAAPILCAGITTYTALRKSNAKSGQWVVISGAGGGLGHIAVQLGARGMAFRIIGIDHPSKEAVVMEGGAEAFVDVTKFDDKAIVEEVKGITGGKGAAAVIGCTSSNRAYAQSLGMLGLGGTLVCAGVPEGESVKFCTPQQVLFGSLNITSVTVGTRKDAKEAMEFAARGVVKPHVKVEKMERLTEVFKDMSEGKIAGRAVIDLS